VAEVHFGFRSSLILQCPFCSLDVFQNHVELEFGKHTAFETYDRTRQSGKPVFMQLPAAHIQATVIISCGTLEEFLVLFVHDATRQYRCAVSNRFASTKTGNANLRGNADKHS